MSRGKSIQCTNVGEEWEKRCLTSCAEMMETTDKQNDEQINVPKRVEQHDNNDSFNSYNIPICFVFITMVKFFFN